MSFYQLNKNIIVNALIVSTIMAVLFYAKESIGIPEFREVANEGAFVLPEIFHNNYKNDFAWTHSSAGYIPSHKFLLKYLWGEPGKVLSKYKYMMLIYVFFATLLVVLALNIITAHEVISVFLGCIIVGTHLPVSSFEVELGYSGINGVIARNSAAIFLPIFVAYFIVKSSDKDSVSNIYFLLLGLLTFFHISLVNATTAVIIFAYLYMYGVSKHTIRRISRYVIYYLIGVIPLFVSLYFDIGTIDRMQYMRQGPFVDGGFDAFFGHMVNMPFVSLIYLSFIFAVYLNISKIKLDSTDKVLLVIITFGLLFSNLGLLFFGWFVHEYPDYSFIAGALMPTKAAWIVYFSLYILAITLVKKIIDLHLLSYRKKILVYGMLFLTLFTGLDSNNAVSIARAVVYNPHVKVERVENVVIRPPPVVEKTISIDPVVDTSRTNIGSILKQVLDYAGYIYAVILLLSLLPLLFFSSNNKLQVLKAYFFVFSLTHILFFIATNVNDFYSVAVKNENNRFYKQRFLFQKSLHDLAFWANNNSNLTDKFMVDPNVDYVNYITFKSLALRSTTNIKQEATIVKYDSLKEHMRRVDQVKKTFNSCNNNKLVSTAKLHNSQYIIYANPDLYIDKKNRTNCYEPMKEESSYSNELFFVNKVEYGNSIDE